MKQKLLLKSMLLLFALIAGSTSVWATDVTFTFNTDAGIAELGITKPSASSGTDLGTDPYNKDCVSLTATNGGTNTRVWNSSGTLDLRIYSNGTLTFTAPANITKIVLAGSTVGGFTVTAGDGEFSSGTWTGDAAMVTLKATATEKINTITVTYTAASVEMPTFSPGAGAVEKGTEVTISTETAGANIYYTTDGTTPSSSSTAYDSENKPTINAATTIKAIAIKGGDASLVATAEYTIKKVATPTFSVAAGTVFAGTPVELATTTDGATIHYTTDGTDPTASSPTYSSAISIDADMTIKAIAVKAKWDDSDMASAAYTVLPPVPGLSIDFEVSSLDQYTDWIFVNVGNTNTAITAHGGTKYGANINGSGNGVNTCSITTKNKIAYPGSITFYVSKVSTNTSASSWYVEVSEDGSVWTQVGDAQDAKSMSKGSWVEVSRSLTSYSDVYVRIRYGSSNAIRAVDDIVLTEVKVPVTIASSGYSTIAKGCGLDFANATPAGLEAYIVPSITASTVSLSAIDEAPASTGVILKGTAGATYTIPVKADAAAVGTNKLQAAVAATPITANAAYILKSGEFHLVTAASTVPAGKAYLLASDISSPAPVLNFGFDDATGINAVIGEGFTVNGEFYNLNGQRVAQPTKGLYIVNGKKVVIK